MFVFAGHYNDDHDYDFSRWKQWFLMGWGQKNDCFDVSDGSNNDFSAEGGLC